MPRSTMMSAVMMKTVLLTILMLLLLFLLRLLQSLVAGGKLYAVNLKPQRHMKGVRLGQNLSPQPCP